MWFFDLQFQHHLELVKKMQQFRTLGPHLALQNQTTLKVVPSSLIGVIAIVLEPRAFKPDFT